MATRGVVQFQVKPGRTEDFIAITSELKPVLERHGGKKQRLWQGIAGPGGAVFETFAWVIEFDSWADYGMYLDAVLADEDFQAGAGKLFGADAPATQTASSIENEIEI